MSWRDVRSPLKMMVACSLFSRANRPSQDVLYKKMIKSVEIGDLKICILKSTYLSSCVAPNSKYLKLLFHMYVGYIIGYIQIFNSIFLTGKCDFL
jgi:hypothetical protein